MTEAPAFRSEAQEFLEALEALKDDDYVEGRCGLRGIYRKRDITRGLASGALCVRPWGIMVTNNEAYSRWQGWMREQDRSSGPIRPETRERVRRLALRYGIAVPLPAAPKLDPIYEPDIEEIDW